MFLPAADGYANRMRILREINRRIRFNQQGVQVQSDVNAVLAANVGERRGGDDDQEDAKEAQEPDTGGARTPEGGTAA